MVVVWFDHCKGKKWNQHCHLHGRRPKALGDVSRCISATGLSTCAPLRWISNAWISFFSFLKDFQTMWECRVEAKGPTGGRFNRSRIPNERHCCFDTRKYTVSGMNGSSLIHDWLRAFSQLRNSRTILNKKQTSSLLSLWLSCTHFIVGCSYWWTPFDHTWTRSSQIANNAGQKIHSDFTRGRIPTQLSSSLSSSSLPLLTSGAIYAYGMISF